MTDQPNIAQKRIILSARLDDYFNPNSLMIQITALTLWMPVETVRLRLQCQSELMSQKYLELRYKSWQNAIGRIYQTEGVAAFWKGGMARILNYGLSISVLSPMISYFFNKTNYKLGEEKRNLSAEDLLIPMSIISSSLIFAYPLEYARVRLANSNLKEYTPKPLKQFSGITDVISTTLRFEGMGSLYRGFFLSFLETVMWKLPLFMLNMNLIQSSLGDRRNSAVNEPPNNLVQMVGLIGGLMFAYPANTIRKKMMMSNLSDYRYSGVKQCFRFIMKTEGLPGFYKGASSYLAILGIHAAMPSLIKKQVPINVFV